MARICAVSCPRSVSPVAPYTPRPHGAKVSILPAKISMKLRVRLRSRVKAPLSLPSCGATSHRHRWVCRSSSRATISVFRCCVAPSGMNPRNVINEGDIKTTGNAGSLFPGKKTMRISRTSLAPAKTSARVLTSLKKRARGRSVATLRRRLGRHGLSVQCTGGLRQPGRDFVFERSSKTLFEASIRCVIDVGEIGVYPRVDRSLLDPEEQEVELQYAHRHIYAIGHGCVADWDVKDGKVVELRSPCCCHSGMARNGFNRASSRIGPK